MKRTSFLAGLFLGLMLGISVTLLLRSAQNPLASNMKQPKSPLLVADRGPLVDVIELAEEDRRSSGYAKGLAWLKRHWSEPRLTPDERFQPKEDWGGGTINGIPFHYVPLANSRK